jgi:N-acetylglucosaminyl-diphospho-decaprenol L-rhamnosyltransferase
LTADVVIVTWRSSERVLGCLDRLAEQDVAHRVVLVDNASGDGTVEGVRAHRPDVEVVELPRNVGFGAAANVGVARGKCQAIVLVNDDVEMEPGCLAALLDPLAREPRCGMVAGLTTIPDTDLVDGFGIELDVTLAAYNRGRMGPVDGMALGRLAMPSGGLAAYRRTAFEQAGGFEERLFAYGEDVDLGLRLLADGWTAIAAPGARASHLGGASFGVDSPLQRRLAGFARGFLLRRYGVMRSRAAPRAFIFEALVIGYGLARHRTAVPLRARIAGWRAAGGQRRRIPRGAVDSAIGAREALRRLRAAR